MSDINGTLERALRIQGGGKQGEREVSMAISPEGRYLGIEVVSPTKLLSISSEEAALLSAVRNLDYEVFEVVTMRERIRSGNMVMPSTVQMMVAHARRTGREILYSVVDTEGQIALREPVSDLTPCYSPFFDVIAEPRSPESPVIDLNVDGQKYNLHTLKEMALKGMERAFTLKKSDSRYGAAVVTASGRVHISGQYSGAQGGRSIHAEMSAIISALTDHDGDITRIGLVSDKFPNQPPDMCGACRQFLADAVAGSAIEPRIINFAKDSDDYKDHWLSSYLPSVWSV